METLLLYCSLFRGSIIIINNSFSVSFPFPIFANFIPFKESREENDEIPVVKLNFSQLIPIPLRIVEKFGGIFIAVPE